MEMVATFDVRCGSGLSYWFEDEQNTCPAALTVEWQYRLKGEKSRQFFIIYGLLDLFIIQPVWYISEGFVARERDATDGVLKRLLD